MTSSKTPQEIELDRLTAAGTRTGTQTTRSILKTVPARPPPILTFWSLFRSPFRILQNLLTFFTTFIPFLYRLNLKSTSIRRQLSPTDTASRFIREFEELYGSKHIPFEVGGYADVTKRVKDGDLYLLVILISDEHDDTSAFCKEVLCDEGLEEWIRTNDCVVWGGNIADSEAHTVSNSLTCTRYPFIALIANIPSPTPSSLPQMTLLTRIEGPLPTNRLIPTLTSAVSRTRSLLAQRRAIKAEQNWSRELRRQQEEAYTNSLAADRAREEAQRRAREDAERVEKERQEQQILADIRSKNREQWRLWKTWDLKRMGLVGMKSEIGKTARVGLRLTGGERIVQIFPGEMNLAEVYSFVECYDLLFPQNQGTTLRSSMEEEVQKPVGYEHEFMFRLVVPYPRKVIDSGFTPVKNESGLWPSGSIVVEKIEEDSEEESSDEE